MSAPLVSIITPTYNHAQWISACIRSVQSQTVESWEMIIIDDGSTDETAEIVSSFLTDPRISLVQQKNLGIWHLAETYNKALGISRGRFIAILEGDDMWLPEKLELQLPYFEDETVGICYGRTTVVGVDGHSLPEDILRLSEWKPPYTSFSSDTPIPFLRNLLLLQANVGAVSVTFRKSALEEVGGFSQPSGIPAVDFPTLLQTATEYQTSFVDEPIAIWRFHPGQTTDVHGLAYTLGTTRIALDYYCSLPQHVKDDLQITEEDIWVARRNYVVNAYWRATRSAMCQHEWSKARAYAVKMIRYGGMLRKTEGVFSYIASIFHINLDSIVTGAARTKIGKKVVQA